MSDTWRNKNIWEHIVLVVKMVLGKASTWQYIVVELVDDF